MSRLIGMYAACDAGKYDGMITEVVDVLPDGNFAMQVNPNDGLEIVRLDNIHRWHFFKTRKEAAKWLAG